MAGAAMPPTGTAPSALSIASWFGPAARNFLPFRSSGRAIGAGVDAVHFEPGDLGVGLGLHVVGEGGASAVGVVFEEEEARAVAVRLRHEERRVEARDGRAHDLRRRQAVSRERAPHELAELVRVAAEVDAAYLDASRPGRTLGDVFAAGADVYAAWGFLEEWRGHHQGGLTGYRGREVFAVPGEPTRIPERAALAWNPSITGGAKSEDTALVTPDGLEIVTRTPELGEIVTAGLLRPAIVRLPAG